MTRLLRVWRWAQWPIYASPVLVLVIGLVQQGRTIDTLTQALALARQTRAIQQGTINMLKRERDMAFAHADAQNEREAETQSQLSHCLEVNAHFVREARQ